MAAREGYVDILNQIHKIRQQRPNMVDNSEQYKLVHLVLLECLLAPETAIECNESLFLNVKNVLETQVDAQLTYLNESMWKDQAMQVMMLDNNDDKLLQNTFAEKNRFQNILPGLLF